MRGVWPHEEDEETAFAERAAHHFANNPHHAAFGGDLNPGEFLALRWGLDNDCVVVLKISEDHEPVNYYELVKKFTSRPQPRFDQALDALRDLVKWHGKRDPESDALLPPARQPKEIARAMRLLGEGGAS